MRILHLKNKAIDRTRWDNCINNSINQLTYAYSWYLDVVSPQWEALVSSDYEYVMPIPVKRRYKIPYVVQPMMTQQLGIFSKFAINESIVEKFIKKIPYFSYELNLNEHNYCPKGLQQPNFLLNLHQPYKQIAAQYSKNTSRNIEKAKKLKLKVRSDLTIQEFLDFNSSVEKKFLSAQRSLLEKLLEKGSSIKALKLFGVYSNDNQLIAGLCLLNAPKRLTYLLPVSNKEGKASSAMFFLIDQLIKEEAGKDKILDFEGSRIEGIARFYRGFGARNHPYYILKQFRPSILIN